MGFIPVSTISFLFFVILVFAKTRMTTVDK
jgi:hypothetical protein